MKKSEMSKDFMEVFFEDAKCEWGEKVATSCKAKFDKLSDDDDCQPFVILSEALDENPDPHRESMLEHSNLRFNSR